MNTSNLFRLNTQDLVRGLIVAVLTAVIAWLGNQTGLGIEMNWSEFLQVAIIAALAYLSKNLMSDNQGRVMGKF